MIETGRSATLRFYDWEKSKTDLTVKVDGIKACSIKFQGSDEWKEDLCSFEIPRGAKEISLEGSYQRKLSRLSSMRGSGLQKWWILDLGPILNPLRNEENPFGERLKQAVTALPDFRARYPEIEEMNLELSLGERVEQSALDAASERLKFALPAEFQDMWVKAGRLEIDEAGMVPPDRLINSLEYFAKEWSMPLEEVRRIVGPEGVALYESSTVIFQSFGDGSSYLVYRPDPSGCSGKQVYYWIFEEEVGAPKKLLNGHDGSCKNFVDSMIWLIETEALGEVAFGDAGIYDDQGLRVEGVLPIDFGSSAPQRLQLDPEADKGRLRCSFLRLFD